MLYHVSDLHRALAEMRRILKPGGRFYATTNGLRHLIEIWEWVAAALPTRADILTSRYVIRSFSLQNGSELLSSFFSSVRLVEFPDSLEITEVPPLMDFIVSSRVQVELSDAELDTCRIYLERKLASEGILRITKEMGLFVAE